jgi:sugar phosphate isomerase/epimerase
MKLCLPLVAAAAAWLALAPANPAADSPDRKRDDSASERLGIKLSMQCYTYRALTFFETVDRATRLGVKYLEIYPGQKLKPGSDATTTLFATGRNNRREAPLTKEQIAEVKQKLADTGIRLVAYGVANPFPTDEDNARKAFEALKDLGIGVLVTETKPNDVHDRLSHEFGIRYALHNHPTTWPPDQVLAACQGRNKLIGSCSDTGHWMRADLVPVEQLKKLEGRVEHSHFKDLNEFGKGAHDVPWGTGRGDAKGMLTELKRQGYQGYLSIEYEYGDVKHLDENLPKCVAFFDQTMAELAK